MTRIAIVSAAILLSATLANAAEPIALRDMGSFHVGGRLVEISGKPVKEVTFTPGGVPAKVDPNGTYQVEQMYVQYFLPADEKGAYPLLMWHGGGLTGVTYETTPDGREGWLNYFLRKGWAVYNSDAVERGRAGWAQYPDIFKSEPVFLTTANPFERFRIGDGVGSYNPDPAKRNRSVIGMPILLDMKPTSSANRWEGEIYNAEDGKIYSGSIALNSENVLRIEGCVLGFLCGGQNWSRAKCEEAASSATVGRGTTAGKRAATPTSPSSPSVTSCREVAP